MSNWDNLNMYLLRQRWQWHQEDINRFEQQEQQEQQQCSSSNPETDEEAVLETDPDQFAWRIGAYRPGMYVRLLLRRS